MTSTSTFIITYAALVFLLTSVLSLFNVDFVGAYLVVYAVGFYVATETTPPLHLSAIRRNTIFAILFAGIFIAIALQTTLTVMQTLTG